MLTTYATAKGAVSKPSTWPTTGSAFRMEATMPTASDPTNQTANVCR